MTDIRRYVVPEDGKNLNRRFPATRREARRNSWPTRCSGGRNSELAQAHDEQDRLEPQKAAEGASSEWPLRGEILSHVDRSVQRHAVDLLLAVHRETGPAQDRA